MPKEKNPLLIEDFERSSIMEKLKKALPGGVFLLFIMVISILNLMHTPPEVSKSERRRLKTMPEFNLETVMDGKFMDGFEGYALDSFVWRDNLRTLKALTAYNIFRQSDNNGIYLSGGSAAELLTLNEVEARKTLQKLKKVSDMLPDGLNRYYGIIPDKGFYMQTEHPVVDYARLEAMAREELLGLSYIDIKGALSNRMYYRTDIHWDQSLISPVAEVLAGGMGAGYTAEEYEKNVLHGFYGVYYGQSALPLPAEDLTYLTGGVIDSARVEMLDPKTTEMVAAPMYYSEKFDGVDPYDLFLGGPQPLITIENESNTSGRELYIFRDSFSSSLAPLLVQSYSKITLIDLRYFSASILDYFVDFKAGDDVIFLYGAQILMDGNVLMVD